MNGYKQTYFGILHLSFRIFFTPWYEGEDKQLTRQYEQEEEGQEQPPLKQSYGCAFHDFFMFRWMGKEEEKGARVQISMRKCLKTRLTHIYFWGLCRKTAFACDGRTVFVLPGESQEQRFLRPRPIIHASLYSWQDSFLPLSIIDDVFPNCDAMETSSFLVLRHDHDEESHPSPVHPDESRWWIFKKGENFHVTRQRHMQMNKSKF